MQIAVVGVGATGSRVARQLVSTDGVERVIVVDGNSTRAKTVVESLANEDTQIESAAPDGWTDIGADAVVIASEVGTHYEVARRALASKAHVVSTADNRDEVMRLLSMNQAFDDAGLGLIVGAGFSPGLSCLLAVHAGEAFDEVDEIHVARVGTGGKACGRQAKRSIRRDGHDWVDGQWIARAAGSGRELCWFPDPIGARDCYQGELVEPLLLSSVFPEAKRITSKLGSSRSDRLRARAKLAWGPANPEKPGALRVEVRGRLNGRQEISIFGVIDRPAVAGGAVAAISAIWAVDGRLRSLGAAGLGGLVESTPFLSELARRGVKAAVFDGFAGP